MPLPRLPSSVDPPLGITTASAVLTPPPNPCNGRCCCNCCWKGVAEDDVATAVDGIAYTDAECPTLEWVEIATVDEEPSAPELLVLAAAATAVPVAAAVRFGAAALIESNKLPC